MQMAGILPKLRHERWMGWTEIEGRRLVPMPLPGLPRVALGEDTPERFFFLPKPGLASAEWAVRSFEEWEAIAVSNLARRPRRWKIAERSGGVFGVGGKPSRLEYIDEFACEHTIDATFMNEAHALLGSKLLAVAIPVRGILVAVDGANPAHAGNLADYARRGFVGAPQGLEPITPHIILFQDGKPRSIIMSNSVPDPHLQHLEPARGFPWPVQDAGCAAASPERSIQDPLDEAASKATEGSGVSEGAANDKSSSRLRRTASIASLQITQVIGAIKPGNYSVDHFDDEEEFNVDKALEDNRALTGCEEGMIYFLLDESIARDCLARLGDRLRTLGERLNEKFHIMYYDEQGNPLPLDAVEDFKGKN